MIKVIVALILPILLLGSHATISGMYAHETDPVARGWPSVPIPSSLDIPGVDPPQSLDARLEGSLRALAESDKDRAAVAQSAGLRLENGLVQVHVVAAAGEETAAREALNSAGGEVTGELEGVIQAWVPPNELPALAGHPAVNAIRSPELAVIADPDLPTTVSEGLAVANVAAWHGAGWRGQGTRIAIIDAGFQGYSNLLGSELPATVTVKNFVDGQPDSEVNATTLHGTACAEIIHDMVPLADLYLLKISTDIDLNQAVDYAISQSVDVISTSLTFVNVTPGDGTGRFATMVQRARDAGVLWVTAAGNYRETHWSGAFTDADGDGLHEYAPGVEVNVFGPGNDTAFLIPAYNALTASIRWDDWTAVNQDYRLLLLRYNSSSAQYEIVSSSNNAQTGLPGQRPTERTTYVTNGASAIYGVAIQRISGNRAINLHLLTPNRELDRRVNAISLGNLADVAEVVTVAAVDVRVPHVREDYSSEGPTNGPGGIPTGGRQKPDLTAFANITTASYYPSRFNGTSAATPHVSGAAALVISAYPHTQPAEIKDYLQARAIDQGSPGVDTQFGQGRLHLGTPPEQSVGTYRLYNPLVVTMP